MDLMLIALVATLISLYVALVGFLTVVLNALADGVSPRDMLQFLYDEMYELGELIARRLSAIGLPPAP